MVSVKHVKILVEFREKISRIPRKILGKLLKNWSELTKYVEEICLNSKGNLTKYE